MATVEEMKVDRVEQINRHSEREVEDRIDSLIRAILDTQRGIKTLTERLKAEQQELRDIEAPEVVTLEQVMEGGD